MAKKKPAKPSTLDKFAKDALTARHDCNNMNDVVAAMKKAGHYATVDDDKAKARLNNFYKKLADNGVNIKSYRGQVTNVDTNEANEFLAGLE